MFKKLSVLILTGLMAMNLCGCVAMMALLADSAKAKETVNLPYGDTLEVVKATLKTQNIEFRSADIRKNIAEVKGTYTDGRTIRILVTRTSDTESRISVRAGTSEAGREDATIILEAIVQAAKAQSPHP